MIVTAEKISTVLDTVIQELQLDPIDLLSIGDMGESAYLAHARCSYLRTVLDICRQVEVLGLSPHETSVLEVGSFLGVVSTVLARLGFPVTALDLPEFMSNQRLIERYRQEGVAMLSANLRDYKLPADSGGFRFVIMCETLEHLNFNPLPVMAEINRVLAEDGYLYLSLPNQASLVNRCKLLVGRSIHNPISDFCAQLSRNCNMLVGIHWREYTLVELRDLLDISGFCVRDGHYFVSHQSCLPARLVYFVFPALRPNLTLLAQKSEHISAAYFIPDVAR